MLDVLHIVCGKLGLRLFGIYRSNDRDCCESEKFSESKTFDPEEIVEFVDRLKEEDFVIEILSEVISVWVGCDPLIKKVLSGI